MFLVKERQKKQKQKGLNNMNEIFKVKRKLHFFINYAFYFLFFAAGFLLGGGSLEKILDFFNIGYFFLYFHG